MNGYNANFFPGHERRHLPMITLGLIASIFRMATEHGLEYCYAAMEPTLLRLLKRFGINFQALSMPVEYHGMRVPSIFPVKDIFKAMQNHTELREIVLEHRHGERHNTVPQQHLAVSLIPRPCTSCRFSPPGGVQVCCYSNSVTMPLVCCL